MDQLTLKYLEERAVLKCRYAGWADSKPSDEVSFKENYKATLSCQKDQFKLSLFKLKLQADQPPSDGVTYGRVFI